jgi:hypothetical protein
MEFIFNDTVITDPTMDETGRFRVNPVDYYGEIFTKQPGAGKVVLDYLKELNNQ